MPWDVDGAASEPFSPRPFRPGAGDGGGDPPTPKPPEPGGGGDTSNSTDITMSQSSKADTPPTGEESPRDPAPGLNGRGLNSLLGILLGFSLFWNVLVLTVGSTNLTHTMAMVFQSEKVDAASRHVCNDTWPCNETADLAEESSQPTTLEEHAPLPPEGGCLDLDDPSHYQPPLMRQNAASTFTEAPVTMLISPLFRAFPMTTRNTS
jgi:hypothetical protein